MTAAAPGADPAPDTVDMSREYAHALHAEVASLRKRLNAVDDELCEAGIEYPLGARGVHDLGTLFEGMAEDRDEARAALAERDLTIKRVRQIVDMAISAALSDAWPDIFDIRRALDGDAP